MKYYYDKNMQYIGANNTNLTPQGASGSTAVKPEHGGMFFDNVNSQWVDELEELEE